MLWSRAMPALLSQHVTHSFVKKQQGRFGYLIQTKIWKLGPFQRRIYAQYLSLPINLSTQIIGDKLKDFGIKIVFTIFTIIEKKISNVHVHIMPRIKNAKIVNFFITHLELLNHDSI